MMTGVMSRGVEKLFSALSTISKLKIMRANLRTIINHDFHVLFSVGGTLSFSGLWENGGRGWQCHL